MDKPLKYKWYLAVLCLFAAFVVKGQYSEEDLLKEASALFEEGKYAEAMPLYSQLLSLNPTKPDFNFRYGATALYGDASKKEEAIKFLRYASTKDGINPKCWYFLGRAYHLNYQFADAIKSYNKYVELGPKKEVELLHIERELESCRNGQNLLSNIKDVVVLDKKQSDSDAFFRIYDLSDIGGKILVTPEELLSPLDIKRNHKSLIHFRGSGTVVYFSSYGKDGKNGLDIYRANVLPTGTFSDPEKLAGFINTPYDEDFPFLHPDNKTFYFSSKGHSSMGGYDIFQSVYDQGLDVFSQPVNLDFAVNTPDDELLYISDSAKVVANFASARSSKQGQLHVYKVKVFSASVDLTLIKGTFDNRVDSKDNLAKITVIDASTNLQIDVQYTDPVTGEYLLSFPRSGKFKFLVEASNSKQVHAGIVEIPSSSGVNAYLQEMDLVSSAGAEKLLINNLFDQQYQGDIAQLAQKLLKQKASLDVNFNATQETVPVITAAGEQDIADASSAAGFSTGLTNQAVLDQAISRNQELEERKTDIGELRLGAVDTYIDKVALAEQKTAEIAAAIAKANGETGDSRGKSMFEAGLLKMEAEAAILEAQNAKVLSDELEKLAEDVESTLAASIEQSEYLAASIETGDFQTALNALKTEKAWEENNTSAYTNYDVLDLTQSASIKARNEAQSYLERAAKMRSDSEEIENKLVTRKRQRELAKGKRAKELDVEIAQLEVEYQEMSGAADNAFRRAETYEFVALNKRQQYHIVVDLTESFLEGEVDYSNINPEMAKDGAGLELIANELSETEIDNGVVAEYLKNHPEALDSMGDDMAALSFRKQYSNGEASVNIDLTAENISENESDPTAVSTEEGENNAEDLAVTESETGEENSTVSDGEIPNEEGGFESETEPSQEDFEGDGQLANQSDGGGGTALPAGGGGVIVPVIVEGGSESEEPLLSDESVAETETPEETYKQTKSVELNTYSDMSTTEMLAADQQEIEAAEDWISIIDGSIEDINQSSNGSLSQADQNQLDQYIALKSAKEAEISAREERMEVWRQSDQSIDDHASADSQTIAEEPSISEPTIEEDSINEEAIATAMADVEELDTAYLTRLETKIPSTYDDRRYMGQIHALNSGYLSDMSVIELSGKSDPEIAADRMRLNETLIGQIDDAMNDFSLSQDKKDMLLELRRIKTLEIKQDIEMQSGSLAFAPRTSEGRDLTEAAEEERLEREMYDPSNIPGLSPEMRTDLSVSYSRSLVLEGYESSLSTIENSSSETRMKTERIGLNEAYLNELQAEIQLYAEAVKNVDNTTPNAVNKRYEELLSERSTVIDEINTDKTFLAFAEAATIAEGRDLEPEPVHDYAAEFDTLYQTEMATIELQELTEEQAQRELANLNSEIAGGIDLAISTLTLEMDETTSEERRDAIQIEIQKLDAIAADKRQESDRLNAVADELSLTAATENEVADGTQADGEEVAQTSDELTEPTVDIESLRAEIDLEPVDLKEVNYKSLNANIALNTMKPLVVSTNEKKEAAKSLLATYQETQDPAERQIIAAELLELQGEIEIAQADLTKELAKSNAPEIAFYRTTNQELMGSIAATELDVVTDEKEMELANRAHAIEGRLTENNTRFEIGEITEIERVNNESMILGDMAELNTELGEINKVITDAEVSTSTASVTGEMTEDEASLYSDRIPSSMQFLLRDPENMLAKGSNEYVSPVLEAAYQDMSSDQIEAYQNEDERLVVESDFVNSAVQEDQFELLEHATAVDARGLKLLSSSPEQLDYLVAAVRADSIGQLEKAQAEYANEMVRMSSEELTEVRRLREAAILEQDDKTKEGILVRAARLEIVGVEHYEKGSIAARRAEELRVMRQTQEKMLASSAQSISIQQKSELDAILRQETYKIIPSDLASKETGEPPLKAVTIDKPEQTTEPINEDIAASTTATTTKPETTVSTPAKGSGNWLAMVEVVAEKTDFSDVSETMFIQVDTPVYSERRPIPIDPEMPKGLIFQVQVGAFRNPIPQDLFAQFAPVMGQKLDNGITRYRAGIFRVYKDATNARDIIRSNGYSDAFVVVYLDGEKLSGAQVQDILAQAKTAIAADDVAQNSGSTQGSTSTEPISGSGQPNSDGQNNETENQTLNSESAAYYNDPEAAEAAQVEVTPGLFYTVQVGVYSKPVKLDALFNLSELNSELTASGVIRYTTGRFATVGEASSRKTVARDKGVSDAFVTAYYNGKRVSLDEAARIIAEQGQEAISPNVVGESTNPTSQNDPQSEPDVEEGITYVIVIGTFMGDVPQELANIFLERSDLQIRRVDGPNGSSMYMSPEFESRSEANNFLQESRAAGIENAIMGKMKDGNIISLE